MLGKESLIGISTMAALFDIKQYERIDIIVPFVTYGIYINYDEGDIIEPTKVIDILDTTFGFRDVPLIIVERALKKIKKHKKCLVLKQKHYFLVKKDSSQITTIETKMHATKANIDFLANKLKLFFNGKKIEYSKEEILEKLFVYLESHGFDQYYLDKSTENIPPFRDRDNFLIAEFYNEISDSEVEKSFEQLLSGIILMNTVYLPKTIDYSSNSTRFKKLKIYVDTSLLMSLLKLKSMDENLRAEALIKLKPAYSKIYCFTHTLEELKAIIAKSKSSNNNMKIEYFIENSFSNSDIDFYNYNIKEELKKFDIEVDTKSSYTSLSENMKYSLVYDSNELGKILTKNMYGYKRSQLMLDNDLKSIEYISFMRRGGSPTSLEYCNAIFITSNSSLAFFTNKFLDSSQISIRYNLLMSTTDFISILWAKSGNQSDYAKDILMQYAQIANIDFTTSFKYKLKNKIKTFIDKGEIDENKVSKYFDFQVLSCLYKETSGEIDNLSLSELDTIVEGYISSVVDEKVKQREKEIRDREVQIERDNEKELIRSRNYFKNKAAKIADFLSIVLALFVYLLYALPTLILGVINLIQYLNTNNHNIVLLAIMGVSIIISISLFTYEIVKLKFAKFIQDETYKFLYYRILEKYLKKYNKTF